jgi:AraC-like DNA-binding protein
MSPYLELVGIQDQESFKVWAHGYPYETVRWHFHPEYEINLITHTSGRFYVGDHTGVFQPGALFMVGPNIPHNWISEVPDELPIPQRCIVLQFSGKCIRGGMEAFPELARLERLLVDSQRGILFSSEVADHAAVLLSTLLKATGFRRVHLFLSFLEMLSQAQNSTLLATTAFVPDPEGYQSTAINQVLKYLEDHIDEDLNEAKLSRYAGMERSAFSRFFRRHTSVPFIQYVNRLRINRACELLITSEMPVTDICYACGFSNLSNFNRHFLSHKNMPPTKFRNSYLLNADFEVST